MSVGDFPDQRVDVFQQWGLRFRGARRQLPVTQRLGEKGPQNDLGAEDVVLPEQRAVFCEGPLDGLGREHLGKWQALVLEERVRDRMEPAVALGLVSG